MVTRPQHGHWSSLFAIREVAALGKGSGPAHHQTSMVPSEFQHAAMSTSVEHQRGTGNGTSEAVGPLEPGVTGMALPLWLLPTCGAGPRTLSRVLPPIASRHAEAAAYAALDARWSRVYGADP
mmetsp:Transcript_111166/g.314574  ORF Transcript_111166/g.314574 Transcript_111166/m.314574 type:complete len:123 (+) Transcript_111166:73-441(+)